MSNPEFAAALSTHEETRAAVDEVIQSVDGKLTQPADLAMVFLSRDHFDQASWVAAEIQQRTGAGQLLGCTAEAIAGGGREIEGGPAISLWLAHLPQVELSTMRLTFERQADGNVIHGWPEGLLDQWPEGAWMLLLGDPFSFPADTMLEQLNENHSDARVVGGMASGGASPGENRLLLGGEAVGDGAVAVLLQGGVRLRTIVSQGCRPIGPHFVVTQAEQNVIRQLGGKPALLQLKGVFDELPNHEQALVQRGLHLGRVVNEYQDRFEQGDFLVRNVLGVDPDEGAVAIGDFVRVGQTVCFHVRDRESADVELRQLLSGAKRDETDRVAAALLFTCNGRGSRLFGEPNHDAGAIQEVLGEIPLAGFFAQGEIGPVGGKNFMHGFTASVALFEGD